MSFERRPAAEASPGLDALDWAPVLDSQSHVEHDAAAWHASDGVEVRLDHLRELPEQEGKAQHQLAQRLTIEHGAAAESVELTAAGRELWPVLHALLVWGGHHRHANSRTYKHASCGTKLGEDSGCPSCKTTPDVADIITEPHRSRGSLRDDPVAIALRVPHRLLEPIETT